MCRRWKNLSDFPPNHPGNDPRFVSRTSFVRSDCAPVAEYGYAIADLKDLIKLVRNINKADATFSQFAENAEERFNFRASQRRGGLVKDEHARILGKGLGNLDQLLLTDAQVAERCMSIN